MSGINVARLLLGGLVAGVVVNAGDFVINSYLLADDMVQLSQRLGLNQADVKGSQVTWIVVDFIYGILLVFSYAAIRPRFGPGPATAIVAGLVLYLAITVVLFGFMSMGMFVQDAFFRSAGLQLVVTLAASLAGGMVYKE
jgi:hypothetical protein